MANLIVIRCWFENSEEWLNSLIETKSILKARIPGGSRPGIFLYEEWVLIGSEISIERFQKFIKDGGYDVDIEVCK